MADSIPAASGIGSSFFNMSTILFVVLLIGLIAVFIYFYRSYSALGNDLESVKQYIRATEGRFSKLTSDVEEHTKQIKAINKTNRGTQKILNQIREEIQLLGEDRSAPKPKRHARQNVRIARSASRKQESDDDDTGSDSENSDDDSEEEDFKRRVTRK